MLTLSTTKCRQWQQTFRAGATIGPRVPTRPIFHKKFGRYLPHSATQQGRLGVGVSKAAARPGDLLVFGSPGRYTHAAIYAGNGAMWDSSTSGQPVALRRIWSPNFAVRRLV